MATILIVEDDPSIRTLLSEVLQRWKYTVATATDGLHAMSILRSIHVDLVICDISMPRMDGYEFMLHIRESLPYRSSLPAIAVSGALTEPTTTQAFEHGFDAYLSKPIELHHLRSVISHLLRSATDNTVIPFRPAM